MAKKGFYPWIKSIFGKKDPEPVECVYAGPVKKPLERPAPEGVYAGPEYFENRGPFTGKVYAGPVPPKDEQPVMEDVYAGPEFFERDPDCTEETPEEDAPLPPDEIERLEAQMEKIAAEEEAMQKNYEILLSFPGIGIVNAMCFLCYTDNFKKFDLKARKIATYWGVAPFGEDSGTSVHKNPHVSHFCNHWLKAILSNAANSAILCNPLIIPYYKKLQKA